MLRRCIAGLFLLSALAGCGTTTRATHANVRDPACTRPIPRDLATPGPWRVAMASLALKRAGRALDPVAWFPVAPRGCRFPLILFSHGHGTTPKWYSRLTSRLASEGFVVLGPHHPDATAQGDEAAGRVQDLVYLLDNERSIARRMHFAGELGSGVGAAGHSFGGFTAAAVASMEPRVSALVVMAAGAPPQIAAQIHAPTLVIAGGADRSVPAAVTHGFYRSLPQSTSRGLMVIEGRGHNSYGNGCALPAVQTCAIVQRAVVATFLTYLAHRTGATAPIDPAVPHPRVRLRTVGMPS